jgi:hypothetical protein
MTSARNVNSFDGSGDTLVSDFMQHTVDAIAPAWSVNTTRALAGRARPVPDHREGKPAEGER